MSLLKEQVDQLIQKKSNTAFNELLDLIEEGLDNNFIFEERVEGGKKFQLVMPKFSPSEAWGDPESMDRKQINEIFRVVRGGGDIGKRIQYLNQYMDPARAKRKTSPRVIINTMIIIESLKAALNHFNESSAGFVFEAFMAALTGGKQQSGRVKGTLPIEDFVAFTEFGGKSLAVSLKLLQKRTYIKGSFTNLMDYLFVRGEPEIKYLVAYKNAKENVESLDIYDFTISKDNIVQFIMGGDKNTKLLIAGVDPNELQQVLSSGDTAQIAQVVTQLPGYNKNGMLHTKLAIEDEPDSEALKKAYSERTPMTKAQQEKYADKIAAARAKLGKDPQMQYESFHESEKAMMEQEGLMLAEGKESGSQWKFNFNMMQTMGDALKLQHHGVLDFSQQRIDAISEIYARKLGEQILTLLESVQSLTTNVGSYFSERMRKNAIQSGAEAVKNAEEIQTSMEGQLSKDSEETP